MDSRTDRPPIISQRFDSTGLPYLAADRMHSLGAPQRGGGAYTNPGKPRRQRSNSEVRFEFLSQPWELLITAAYSSRGNLEIVVVIFFSQLLALASPHDTTTVHPELVFNLVWTFWKPNVIFRNRYTGPRNEVNEFLLLVLLKLLRCDIAILFPVF